MHRAQDGQLARVRLPGGRIDAAGRHTAIELLTRGGVLVKDNMTP
jgi:hypothetical protein